MTIPDFILRPVTFNFLLGEILIARRTRLLCVRKVHFTENTLPVSELHTIFSEIPTEAQGCLFSSHPIDNPLPQLSLVPSGICYIPLQTKRYYINLSGTFEEYMQKFSSKTRSTLRRKIKKFRKLSGGDIDWKTYRSRDEANEFYHLARELSVSTYQERLFDAGLPTDEKFKEQMFELADKGQMFAYILFLNNKAVAYLYTPFHNNIFLYQILGYKSELSKYSPGTVLQFLVLEKLLNEGSYRMFDFTAGEGGQKAFFGTGFINCADIYYLRRDFLNVLLVGSHFTLALISEGIVWFLFKTGLKMKIKKLLRQIWKRPTTK